ncbi:phosphatase 2C-like domain-containing protein [Lipomyces doorenjongii]|uniref:phosphatase 2C-like domain-containing protein n=1 Tax=Lipomyces doorenjongii TaxID=383834 RepID=UPI0034CD914C
MRISSTYLWTVADSYKFIFQFSKFQISEQCTISNAQHYRHFTTYYVAPPAKSVASKISVPRLRVPLLNAPTHLGHYTSRVTRPDNEDRYSVSVLTVPATSSLAPLSLKTKAPPERQVFFYSVFDGHGGSECSDFLAQNLATYVENADLHSIERLERGWKENIGGYWTRWRGHLEKFRSRMSKDSDLLLRVPISFLQADYYYTMAERPSGSTCTSVLLYSLNPSVPYWSDAPSRLLVAHVGDTRCILCDRNGVAHALTSAHHLSSPTESARLRRYAASFFTDSFGEERFGNVENTRSFGDRSMKRLGVTAEPDLTEYTLGSRTADDGFGGDEPFLVLVSDGVSKFAADQEIVDIVTSTGYRSGYARGTPQDAAREVVQFAADVGGDDNSTCIVVRLSGWGKWTSPVDRTGDLREYRLREALDKVARRQ